jgi:hypothetical protein
MLINLIELIFSLIAILLIMVIVYFGVFITARIQLLIQIEKDRKEKENIVNENLTERG